MNQEENVYVEENFHTEAGVHTQAGEDKENISGPNASAVLGKFKDVGALAKAYESLQAEFTRRSQRLKQLEKLAENSQKEQGEETDSGVEKLRKNARRKREENKAFNKFLSEVETLSSGSDVEWESEKEAEVLPMYEMSGETFQTETAKEEEKREEGTKEGEKKNAWDSHGGGELSVEKMGNVEPSETLYEKVRGNEEVRLKIIGEYLRSIGRSIAPLTVGGGAAITPPLRPNNIQDAGAMALSYFKTSAEK